jgi:hypothetical protein
MLPVRFRQRRLAAARRRRRRRLLKGLPGYAALGRSDRLSLPGQMARFRFHAPLPLCVRLVAKRRHGPLPPWRRRPLGRAIRASRRASAYRRALVDPLTGRTVPSGMPGAITREAYYARQLVDSKTGRLVPPDCPGAVPRGTFYNRRMVDSMTGQPVAEGAPGAIPSSRYRQRQFAARKAATAGKPPGRGRGRPRHSHPSAGTAEAPQAHAAPRKPVASADVKADPAGAPN